MKFQLILRCFSYGSPRVVFLRQKIEWSFKFQLIPPSLSFFLFNILIWLETVTRWNITPLCFCLDDTHPKNKKTDPNIEKLKGTLKKTKITKGYDLVLELSSDANWCEPRDHVTHNQDWDLIPESRNRSGRSVTQWKPATRHQHYWIE